MTASTRPQVHNVVRTGHHVEVVLHADDGVALFDERVKRREQLGHVVKMKARGGFVEDEDGVPGAVSLGQEGAQFDALGLSTAQGGGALSEGDVAEPDVEKGSQLADDAALGSGGLGTASEECGGFGHGHGQHVVDGVAIHFDFQHGVGEACGPCRRRTSASRPP